MALPERAPVIRAKERLRRFGWVSVQAWDGVRTVANAPCCGPSASGRRLAIKQQGAVDLCRPPLVAKRSDYRPRSAPLESPTQSASPVRALGTDDSPCRVSRADESDAEANAACAWSSAPPSSRGGKRQYFPPIESVPGGKAPPIDPWIAANAPGGTGVNAAPRQGARVVSARPTRVSSGASASAAAALTAPRTLAMRTARRTISSWPSREPVPFESATRVPGTALRRRRRRRR